MSDPGNALFLTDPITHLGTNYTGTGFLNAQGYVVDPSGHFSNGPTAVEHLASSLGLATNRGWATPYAPGTATNYAVGGALTGPFLGVGAQHLDGFVNPAPVTELALTGITSQVSRFLTSAPVFNPATTLFTIQGGGNDIFAANTLGLTGLAMLGVVDQATTHLQESIAALAGAGARRILWMTLPDLGLTPLYRLEGQEPWLQGLA